MAMDNPRDVSFSVTSGLSYCSFLIGEDRLVKICKSKSGEERGEEVSIIDTALGTSVQGRNSDSGLDGLGHILSLWPDLVKQTCLHNLPLFE